MLLLLLDSLLDPGLGLGLGRSISLLLDQCSEFLVWILAVFGLSERRSDQGKVIDKGQQKGNRASCFMHFEPHVTQGGARLLWTLSRLPKSHQTESRRGAISRRVEDVTNFLSNGRSGMEVGTDGKEMDPS